MAGDSGLALGSAPAQMVEVDWQGLVPEPAWSTIVDTPTRLALGIGSTNERARAYFGLAERLYHANSEHNTAIYAYVAAHALRPTAAAYINLGIVLRRTTRDAVAAGAFDMAIRLTPYEQAGYRNLAQLQPDRGVALLQSAIVIAPSDASAHLALANALHRRDGLRGESQHHFERAVELAPALAGGAPHFGYWRDWESTYWHRRAVLGLNTRDLGIPSGNTGIRYQETLQFPFSGEELRRIASKQAAATATPSIPPKASHTSWQVSSSSSFAPGQQWRLKPGEPLRVAYVGALSDEPQLRAMAPIFSGATASINLTFFAMTLPPAAAATGAPPEYVTRMYEAIDAHGRGPMRRDGVTTAARSETGGAAELALALRSGGFHLLLDGAWTKECEPHGRVLTQLNCALGMLADRGVQVPPVQFSVLAAPVTTGRPVTAYTLADAVAAPPPRAAHLFTERLVLLPTGYPFAHATWASHIGRSDGSLTRQSQALPTAALVLASFVQRWKLNPIVWPSWLNILRRVPASVLWLLQHPLDGTTEAFSRLLRSELADVRRRRMHIMRRLPLERHVRRVHLADLTLDTHPYSAHTTAADAIWVHGPPWLALSAGERFDSRLSTAVVAAIGTPESSGSSLRAFEDVAVALSSSITTHGWSAMY